MNSLFDVKNVTPPLGVLHDLPQRSWVLETPRVLNQRREYGCNECVPGSVDDRLRLREVNYSPRSAERDDFPVPTSAGHNVLPKNITPFRCPFGLGRRSRDDHDPSFARLNHRVLEERKKVYNYPSYFPLIKERKGPRRSRARVRR